MDCLYTIVFDPLSSNEWRLFDRTFYIEPSVAISRCLELNKNDLFERFHVVKVYFEFLSID